MRRTKAEKQEYAIAEYMSDLCVQAIVNVGLKAKEEHANRPAPRELNWVAQRKSTPDLGNFVVHSEDDATGSVRTWWEHRDGGRGSIHEDKTWGAADKRHALVVRLVNHDFDGGGFTAACRDAGLPPW